MSANSYPTIAKPAPHQHPAWSAHYITNIADDGAVLDHLANGLEAVLQLVTPLTEAQWLHRYAPDKWSIKEVLVHLMDAERVFAYRGLSAARGDQTPLPGFDHDAYVPKSEADARSPESILAEYRSLRASTIQLFQHLSPQALDAVGEASGHPISAKAMVYMIAGHEAHHLRIFKERYL